MYEGNIKSEQSTSEAFSTLRKYLVRHGAPVVMCFLPVSLALSGLPRRRASTRGTLTSTVRLGDTAYKQRCRHGHIYTDIQIRSHSLSGHRERDRDGESESDSESERERERERGGGREEVGREGERERGGVKRK